MVKHLRIALAITVISVMVITMAGFAGADNGEHAPCPDFFYQNPLPICDWPVLESADADTAWAVSLGGLIIKTDNGGDSWEYQWSDLQRDPDTPPLRGISVVDSNVVWACGDGGAVIVTADGGANWSVKPITVPAQDFQLHGISALNDQIAWVVGEAGNVYTTSNGGNTWTNSAPGGAGDLDCVCALSDQKAWVGGEYNYVAVTADGGGSWNPVGPALGPSSTIQEIKAFNDLDVYAIGNAGSFYSTSNGGGAWNWTNVGDGILLFGMSFRDMNNGWICGNNDWSGCFMAFTNDSGATWNPVTPPQLNGERNVTAVDTAGAQTIWSCSVDGALIRSTDAGKTWNRSDTVWTKDTLSGICAVDNRSAWIVGSSGCILRTFNGGRTWVNQPSHTSSPLGGIDAADSSTAWAVGVEGVIIHTNDYGSTWTRQPSGAGEAELRTVSVVDKKEAWVSGLTETGGILLHTTNGGSTWETVRNDSAPLFAVKTQGSEGVWYGAVESNQGYIYRSTDKGNTWSKGLLPRPVPIQEVTQIMEIHPVDDSLCLALVETVAGITDNFNYLYKTTDGGQTWNVVGDFIAVNNTLFGLVTTDGQDIWTCGASLDPYSEPTTTFHSTDGGQNWENGKDFYRTVLFGMDSADGKAIWTTGYMGTILRSTCPSLYSISPDSAPNTGVVQITDLAGSMFWDGMEVWLEKDGTRVDATNVSLESPYKATCRFDLNAVPEGTYDVVARNANGVQSTLSEGFNVTTPTTWYLPEGSTGADAAGGFETWVLVENPNEDETRVDITYMTPEGTVNGPQFTMPAQSRQTVNVADTVPNNYSVSTMVQADRPVVAERAMYWNTSTTYRQCSHGSIGLNILSKDWYMAEGSTGSDAAGGFETWILVQNPGDDQADVSITYMTPQGPVDGPDLTVSPGSRQTVNVADTVPGQWSVSTSIESSVPVTAERATYWNSTAVNRQAAIDSIGASGAARLWYLAEGSTGSNESGTLETWVLLANPCEHSVRANLYYQVPWGQVAGPEVIIEPLSRETVNIADTVPGQFDVSTHVIADGPIVAERATYWNTGATYRQAAQGSIGVMSPRTHWLVAEGSTGVNAQGSFDSWILIQNPNQTAAEVALTYMTPEGPVTGPAFTLPPGSRKSVSIADTLANTWSVSTMVESDAPVVVDRTIYWNSAAQTWQAAQSSKGYGSN